MKALYRREQEQEPFVAVPTYIALMPHGCVWVYPRPDRDYEVVER